MVQNFMIYFLCDKVSKFIIYIFNLLIKVFQGTFNPFYFRSHIFYS